jgi:hypothetical protein
MKVFWVIAYDRYYPRGGLDDVRETFATRAEADEYAATVEGYDEIEIHDVSRMLGVQE